MRKTYHLGRMAVPALKGVSLAIEKGDLWRLQALRAQEKRPCSTSLGAWTRQTQAPCCWTETYWAKWINPSLPGLRLQKVGFVFQSYNLIPVLTAAENVEFVMLLQGVEAHERRRRAETILDEVGLGGMHDRRPSALSGGQQQRVAVARAIVSGPSIVLADEPTANLDSETGKGLLDIMKEMNERRGVTFVFSTHDQMVMDYAKRVILLRDGQVIDDRIKTG